MDCEEVDASEPKEQRPYRKLSAVEVRIIYELLVDRFEQLDMLSRSTSSSLTSDRLTAEKVRIENLIKTMCD